MRPLKIKFDFYWAGPLRKIITGHTLLMGRNTRTTHTKATTTLTTKTARDCCFYFAARAAAPRGAAHLRQHFLLAGRIGRNRAESGFARFG